MMWFALLCMILPMAATLQIEPRIFRMCNSTKPYPNTLNVTFYPSDDRNSYYGDFHGNFKIPMGRTSTVYATLEYASKSDGNFIRFYKARKKDICAFLSEFAGEFYNELTTAMSWPKNVCPIPTGKWGFKKLKLNFNKMNFIAFPQGYIKIRSFVKDVNMKEICCVHMEAYNK